MSLPIWMLQPTEAKYKLVVLIETTVILFAIHEMRSQGIQ